MSTTVTTAIPILATKLFIPRAREDVVQRPRLTERLERGLAGKLTLISAPPGFGKTTVVVEWRQSTAGEQTPLAWLSLDELDNDSTRFLTYVVHALKTVSPEFGDGVLAVLQSDQNLPVEVPLTILVNELEQLEQRTVLALDDYHLITNQQIHQALGFLIDHMPTTLRLIVTARTDPPLMLSRLRGRRDLTEFRSEDLRFTPEETAYFLNDVMGLELEPDRIAALEERTEGWIAGLLLAALSTEQDLDGPASIEAFSGDHRYIFDYLAEEVLQRQDPAISRFLLSTSVLTQMTGRLCDAVTGHTNGHEMLEHLTHANLFVVPLDDTRGWYRYHHLFGEFLQARFRQEDPEGWRNALITASEWNSSYGDMGQAVGYALAAEEWDLVAGYLEQMGQTLVVNGRSQTLESWLAALPEAIITSRPELAILQAWALLLHRKLDEAETWLNGLPEDSPADIKAQELAVRGSVSWLRGDPEQTVRYSQQALELIDPLDTFLRGMVLVHYGSAQRMNERLSEAVKLLERGVALCKESENNVGWILATGQLAVARMTIGDLQAAHDGYQQAIAFERDLGLEKLGIAIAAHLGDAEVLREWNRLEEASDEVERSIATLRAINNPREIGTLLFGLFVQARIRFAEGDIGLAGAIADAAVIEANERQASDWEIKRIEALQARCRIAEDKIEAAAAWAERCQLQADDEIRFHDEVAYLTLARLYLEQDNLGDALLVLENMRRLAASDNRRRRLIEVDILEAMTLDRQGVTDGALDRLAHALVFAESEGFIRIFADEGDRVGRLLLGLRARHLHGGEWDAPFSQEYLDQLLEVIGTPVEAEEPIVIEVPELVEQLSARELEVLRLLAIGRTNREIADQLDISIGTIKRHNHNIYGKLGVSSRTQALVRAGELGLVDEG